MDMCYDGALVMPSSYAVMNEEDMTYVEGGMSAKVKWYGIYVHLSNKDVGYITDLCSVGGGASTVLSAVAKTGVGTKYAAIVAGVLWAGSGAIGITNRIGGYDGVNIRIFWNGYSAMLPA